MTRASIYGGSFFVIVTLFGLAPMPHALLAVPVIVLSGLLFAVLGLAFSLRLRTIDFFSFYFTLFLTPLFLFSDVFFPLEERLAPVWQNVAEILPLLHPVRLARAAFRGEGSPALIAWDLTYIVVFCVVIGRMAQSAARRRLTS